MFLYGLSFQRETGLLHIQEEKAGVAGSVPAKGSWPQCDPGKVQFLCNRARNVPVCSGIDRKAAPANWGINPLISKRERSGRMISKSVV